MNTSQIEMKWVRLPRASEDIMGIKRSFIYRLINQGKVRAKRLKSTSGERGITMISLDDLRDFIEAGEIIKPKAQE
jgi:hypothetical protein